MALKPYFKLGPLVAVNVTEDSDIGGEPDVNPIDLKAFPPVKFAAVEDLPNGQARVVFQIDPYDPATNHALVNIHLSVTPDSAPRSYDPMVAMSRADAVITSASAAGNEAGGSVDVTLDGLAKGKYSVQTVLEYGIDMGAAPPDEPPTEPETPTEAPATPEGF